MLNDSQLIAVEQYEIKTIHRIWGLTASSLSFFLVRREKRTRDANNYARRHRFSRLLVSQLDDGARACTAFIKSEEKERLLAVYTWGQ